MGFPTKRTDRRGAAAVEFALVAIPLCLFVFGILEFGRLILVQHSLTAATREGARLAALNTDVNDDDDNHLTTAEIETAIQSMLVGQGINGINVDIYHVEDPETDWATNATLQHRIAIDVQGNYTPMTPVFSFLNNGTMGSIPVSAQSIAHSEGH